VRTVVVLDYGSGNIRSAERAVARAGTDVTVTADADLAVAADGLVVPGVGAFAACMAGLVAVGGPEIIAARLAAGRPTLAICVGHQVLFEAGIEHGVRAAGCDIWPGLVERLHAERLPHMGWNTVKPTAVGCLQVSKLKASISCTATAYATYPRLRNGGSPGQNTAVTASSRRSRTAPCGRLSFIPRSPETLGVG
jgi:imidazole glycerol phosphate synthase glutamine amidotransferase subunit